MQNMINIENLREIVKNKREKSILSSKDLPDMFVSVCSVPPPIKKELFNEKDYAYGWSLVSIKNQEELSKIILNKVWSPCAFYGNHRHGKEFIGAMFGVLDFDGTMQIDLAREFCLEIGAWFIIAPSLRHRVGNLGDRFRMILKFNTIITDLKLYKYNINKLMKSWGNVDENCKDGARLYLQSKTIYDKSIGRVIPVQYISETNKWTQLKIEKNKEIRTLNFKKTNKLPRYIDEFLNDGILIKNTRHDSFLYCAYKLAELGMEKDVALKSILSSPFDRSRGKEKILDQEIINAVNYVYSKIGEKNE
jgi:hypothetical protein